MEVTATEEEGATLKKVPFPAAEAGEELTRGIAAVIQDLVELNLARLIPPENILRFRHGVGWNIRRADASEDTGHFKTIEAIQALDKHSILHNDLGKLLEVAQAHVSEFIAANERIIVETVGAAAERVGNKVSVSDSGLVPETCLEMMRMAKFSSNMQGEVSPPQMLIGPEAAQKLRMELETQGPAYRLRLRVLEFEKHAEAVREELTRLQRYEGFEERR